MYTEETHTCHFTTVKWYTRHTHTHTTGNQWQMVAYTGSHTHKHCFRHAQLCVYSHTHTHMLFKTLLKRGGGGDGLLEILFREIYKCGVCVCWLQHIPHPIRALASFPGLPPPPSFPIFLSPKLRLLSVSRQHDLTAPPWQSNTHQQHN